MPGSTPVVSPAVVGGQARTLTDHISKGVRMPCVVVGGIGAPAVGGATRSYFKSNRSVIEGTARDREQRWKGLKG